MPYALIALVASLALALFHVADSDAPLRSKLSVAAMVVASLVVRTWSPRWSVAATLLQVAAGVYVLCYSKVQDAGR